MTHEALELRRDDGSSLCGRPCGHSPPAAGERGKDGAALAVAPALGRWAAGDVRAQGVVLREIGLSLTEDPRILSRFQEDTGITMEGNSQILGNQITFWLQNYQDYDVNQVNFSQNAPLLAQGAIQSFPTSDIPAWNDQVIELYREPDVPGYSKKSGWPLAGTYTKESFDAGTYDTFIGTPTWFGFDAFGYLEGQAKGDLTSYGAIFDPGQRRASRPPQRADYLGDEGGDLSRRHRAGDLQRERSTTSPRKTSPPASTS